LLLFLFFPQVIFRKGRQKITKSLKKSQNCTLAEKLSFL